MKVAGSCLPSSCLYPPDQHPPRTFQDPPPTPPPRTFQASLQALDAPCHGKHQRLDLAPRLGDGQLEEIQGRALGRLPQLQRGLPLAQAQRGAPPPQGLPVRESPG